MKSKHQLNYLNRFKNDLTKCVKCGFCMSFCPVYRELRTETSVARGKNMLLVDLLSGSLTFSEGMIKSLNECTLCMACTQNCPTEVSIPSMIVAARADKLTNLKASFMYYLICRWLLPKRLLFGRLVRFVFWVQTVFKGKTEGPIRHLSLFLYAFGRKRYIPPVAPTFLRQSVPETSSPRYKNITPYTVGYFTGCMTDFIFPELGQKIITFLTARGIVVVTPSGQKCCGAPIFLGAGDLDNSRRLADANVEAFKDLDYIITDCATCASAMKGYAKHLADTGERHAAYNDHGNRIKDITEFLVDILDLPPSAYTVAPEFRGKKVTWHDPCHLSRYLKVTEQPRQILRSVADIKYEEMPHADICCGMAGTFALNADVLSRKIADRKTADIDASGADIVVTGCPGCRIQLTDAVLRHDMPQKVMHIMELFSA